MATKYFHTGNARRRIGDEFQFEVYGIFGGCPSGVYAAESAEDQAKLLALMSDPRNALEEISLEEYSANLKKNSPQVSQGPIPFNPPPVVNPPVNPVDSSAVIEQAPINPEAFVAAQEVKLPEPGDSFKTGDVEILQPQKPSGRKSRK